MLPGALQHVRKDAFLIVDGQEEDGLGHSEAFPFSLSRGTGPIGPNRDEAISLIDVESFSFRHCEECCSRCGNATTKQSQTKRINWDRYAPFRPYSGQGLAMNGSVKDVTTI
jgi:hypothetical protein